YKSSFILLMVSAHFQNLYSQSKELEVQQFLKELNVSRSKVLLNLSLNKDEVAQCYKFLRLCDDLSLALCQNDFDNHQEPVEIESITGNNKISLTRYSAGQFTLEPWIFEKDEVTFH